MSDVSLLPLPLEGAGTCDVESLPSYLYRLAQLHGTYVGELLKFLAASARKGQGSVTAGGLPKYPKPDELVRPSQTTILLRSYLEDCGVQPLRESTFWLLEKALCRSTGSIVKGFRWCPECWLEQQSLNRPCYFKLIWHLSSVQKCPLHRTPFMSECEHCGCDQTGFKRSFLLDTCLKCEANLAVRKNSLTRDALSASWQDIGLDVVHLFRRLAQHSPEDLPDDGVQLSLNELFDGYWERRQEEILYEHFGRDHLLAMIHGQTPVSLDMVHIPAHRDRPFRLNVTACSGRS